MKAGAWRLRRVRPAGVRGLEVWDRPVAGGLLWQRLGLPRLEQLRREGRGDEEAGAEMAAAAAEALGALHGEIGFTAAWVGGGLQELPGFERSLRESPLPFPLAVSPDRAFAGERGGLALLAQEGRAGVVVDVGQTAVKASGNGVRVVHARDLGALPLLFIDPHGRRPEPSLERVRRAARLVSGAVEELRARAGPLPPAVLLALPCPLDDAALPGACTYGWEGDRRLLPAIAEALQPVLRPEGEGLLLVLNDAELAACSARALLAPGPGERILCLTAGFGPGAALLEA